MSAETVLQLGFWVGAGHEQAWAGEVLQDELDRVQPHPQTPRIIDCLAQFRPAMAVHVPGRNGRLGLVAGPAGTVFGVVIGGIVGVVAGAAIGREIVGSVGEKVDEICLQNHQGQDCNHSFRA